MFGYVWMGKHSDSLSDYNTFSSHGWMDSLKFWSLTTAAAAAAT